MMTGRHCTQVGRVFHLVMIKPTHYDDDGYPIQWVRSAIPSNTLACLNGLAEDARRRGVLGPDVEVRCTPTTRQIDASGPLASSATLVAQVEKRWSPWLAFRPISFRALSIWHADSVLWDGRSPWAAFTSPVASPCCRKCHQRCAMRRHSASRS